MDPFIGEIKLFAGTFAPRGWALCDGQLLAINGNESLFSLIGTTYGGDGRTTFALPDLRGRVPMHAGTGPGLSAYRLGQKGGDEDIARANAPEPAGANKLEVLVGSGTDTNMQPYLAVSYIIALRGVFPARN